MVSEGTAAPINVGKALGTRLPGLEVFGNAYDLGRETKVYGQAVPFFARNIHAQIIELYTNAPGFQTSESFYLLKQPLWLAATIFNYSENIGFTIAVSDNEAFCNHALVQIEEQIGFPRPVKNPVRVADGLPTLDGILANHTLDMITYVLQSTPPVKRYMLININKDLRQKPSLN
jgi:hypothetical protein